MKKSELGPTMKRTLQNAKKPSLDISCYRERETEPRYW